jgi:hypothetical protein
MKEMFALPLVIALLGVTACGGAGKGAGSAAKNAASTSGTSATTTTPKATEPEHPHKTDRDGDSDNNDYAYGRPANAADKRAVRALVKRYYTAAAASDGTKACSLIYSIFAEEIPEVYGEPPGPSALRGSTCAAVMSKLFKQNHHQLVVDLAELKVTDVRVKRHHALALLSFKAMPPRDIRVHRERRAWKIDELLDSGVG